MALVVHCRDVGFDCDGVVKADSEQELLQLVAAHAAEAHGLQEVTDDVVLKVKSVVREDE
ncbi:MAG: DUF1059 domain-containing protein [Anaerolineae bacterium]|nr:DUF1059 domain-containing protein [Anaerolineae bacterium]MCO5193650.1 DUF1059 domain-containing protein [Anaerolineae bacterium]MCO5206522.1 DUF1059 domain-containing protein [Anaerolineae bacterium]